MTLISLLTSCKALSSIICGRSKRREKDTDAVKDIALDEEFLECLTPFDPCSSDKSSASQFEASPSESYADGSSTLRSSSSVLSGSTRLVIRNLYRQWEHDEASPGGNVCHEDEDEELASDTTNLEDSDSPTSPSYTSILLGPPHESTSTLCCTENCLSPGYSTKIGILAHESHSSHSFADYTLDQKLSSKPDGWEGLCKCQSSQSNSSPSNDKTWPFPTVASGLESPEHAEPSSQLIPVASKSLKRVKSVLDLKNMRTAESCDKKSQSRERKAGMIGYNDLEIKSRLKAISLFKKTSQPLLTLKASLSSLNGSLPSSFFVSSATDCGMYYASNFIEVLDCSNKRVHEIKLKDQIHRNFQRIDSGQAETCSVSSEPSTSTTVYSTTFKHILTPRPPIVKRVRFAEPIACAENDDEEEEEQFELPQPTPRARLLPPGLSSYCQRKKEDWSNKIRSQYVHAVRSDSNYPTI